LARILIGAKDTNFLQSLPEGRTRDRVYRPIQIAIVPLLTLERALSIGLINGRAVVFFRQMISSSNDLRMKDFPVDVELSRI
jgi:hypothetical protein